MILPLHLAGTRVDLRSDAEVPRLAERYRGFCGGAGEAAWTLELISRPMPHPRRLTGQATRRDGLVRLEGAEDLGWLDPVDRRGEVSIDPMLVGVDDLLRAALALDVLACGGCLLHAAAVEVDGLAHVAPGPSGRGKSTFASLARRSLSDELAVVLPAGDRFVVHGTPWWTGRAASAPLAAVYRLAWGGEETAPLTPRAALRHLASSLVLPIDEPGERARAFSAAGRIARSVPFRRLAFRPDSDVDALLRGAPTWRAA